MCTFSCRFTHWENESSQWTKTNNDVFNGKQLTFPKILQKNAYKTALIGKWHLKSTPTGFNTWKILLGQGTYYSPKFIENGKTKIYKGHYTTDKITDLAIDYLENRDKEKAFCLLYQHKAPHRNFLPNAKDLKSYKMKRFPLPKTFYDDYKGRIEAQRQDMKIKDMFLTNDLILFINDYDRQTGLAGSPIKRLFHRMTPEQKQMFISFYQKKNEEFKHLNTTEKEEWLYQRCLNNYSLAVKSIDDNIGRLLAYLKKSGLNKNTVIIYTLIKDFI